MPARDDPSERGSDWEGLPSVVDRAALDDLFSLTYEELRRLASSVRRNDRNASLSPTALVNEAWLKLAASPGFRSASPLHFKRGGNGDVCMVTFDEALDQVVATSRDLLALDTALDSLAQINPRQAVMIESRYFGGLEVAETAALLGVSEATILRDWRVAKAWLAEQIVRTR
jgi:DNA-directed RNA polymerase specialized sigma24 family protein